MTAIRESETKSSSKAKSPSKKQSKTGVPKKKVGRPTKRNEQVESAILNAVRIGLSLEDSARVAGVHPSQLFRWANKDAQFREDLEKAKAEAKATLVAKVRRASDVQWTAAAWLLERKWPREFARTRVEVVGPEGGPMKVEVVFADSGVDNEVIDG